MVPISRIFLASVAWLPTATEKQLAPRFLVRHSHAGPQKPEQRSAAYVVGLAAANSSRREPGSCEFTSGLPAIGVGKVWARTRGCSGTSLDQGRVFKCWNMSAWRSARTRKFPCSTMFHCYIGLATCHRVALTQCRMTLNVLGTSGRCKELTHLINATPLWQD